MGSKVKVGGSAGFLPDTLTKFKKEEIGNFICAGLDKDIKLSLKGIDWCRKNEIYLVIGELRNRYTLEIDPRLRGYTREVWEKIKKRTFPQLL